MGNILKKENIRSLSREKLNEFSDNTENLEVSKIIQERLLILLSGLCKSESISSPKIFIYVSKKNEVQTINIINELLKNDSLWVPRCNGSDLEAVEVQEFHNLKLGRYGILEPSSQFKKTQDIAILDFIILPGLSFDLKGGRLGKGKGYYDKFLKKSFKKTKRIAIAYDFQIESELPLDAHDERVDLILTEKRIIVVDPSLHYTEELFLHRRKVV